MTIICTISNKVISGSVNTTFSADNSVENAKYKTNNGIFKYHKVVELFRSRWSIPVKLLREFSQNYLKGKNTLLDIVPFRGLHHIDINALKNYTKFLDN